MALAKSSNRFECHAGEKRKEVPSCAEIAAKYKGGVDAEEVLFKHVT